MRLVILVAIAGICIVPHLADAQLEPPQKMTYGMLRSFVSDNATEASRAIYAGFLSGTVQTLIHSNEDFADCKPTMTEVLKSIIQIDSEAAGRLEDTFAVEVIESVMYSLCSEDSDNSDTGSEQY